MRRVLTLFMAFILVVTNGTAVAGAICQHGSLAGHETARTSGDADISAVASTEEAADSVASQKGALAISGAIVFVADLSASPELPVPLDTARALEPPMLPVSPLVGRSISPLLEPPTA